MPLVVIEIVGGKSPVPSRLTSELADVLGKIFGSEPGQTWVRVRVVPREAYAENESPAPPGAHAVFVAVTKRELPPKKFLRTQAALIAAAVGQACGRPAERIHVIYEPPAAGRVAFGGRLVE
jgi:phenylpyruvate tautomerase PptA (4-oxalocrotonate tautomerase family)